MQIIDTIEKWQNIRNKIAPTKSIGFVPTMGNLHKGHISLVNKASAENDITVVTIFVNPTQFNDKKDLASYPKTLKQDAALLENSQVDYLLTPTYNELYPDNYKYQINETEFSNILEGKHRKGHFSGVLTIVMKLLMLVQPDNTYLGEKDYQQLKLIEGMAAAFFLKTKIIGCETIREPSGLPYSSRNNLLISDQKKAAELFVKILHTAPSCQNAKETLEQSGFKVDYVEEYDNRRLAAVKIGDIRLIDNIKI